MTAYRRTGMSTLGSRARPVAIAVASAVLALVLGACGDDVTATPSGDPEGASTGAPPMTEPQVVGLLSETAAGGRVSTRPTYLTGDTALDRFTGPLERGLGAQLRELVRRQQPGAGRVLAAAVVAIGCDVPPGVHVTERGDGYAIVPQRVADPLPECFAPVTTVALVEVPQPAQR